MNRSRRVVGRSCFRAGELTWRHGPAILLPVLFFAISIVCWKAVITDTAVAVANQVDYEDAALCTKFGFAAGTKEHAACKLDLLDLRHGHEQLIAATSDP